MNVNSNLDIYAVVGRRVRELRERRQLTQNELSAKAGISLKHLGELERGRGNPSLRSIHNLATALQVSLSELFNFENQGKSEHLIREEIRQKIQSASPEILRVVSSLLKES